MNYTQEQQALYKLYNVSNAKELNEFIDKELINLGITDVFSDDYKNLNLDDKTLNLIEYKKQNYFGTVKLPLNEAIEKLDYYINNLNNFNFDTAIYHALNIKKSVVDFDEFEINERKSLNYGHSFGHVIEPLTDYKIPHGEAVLLGIEIINQIFDKNPIITNIINQYTDLTKIKSLNLNKIIDGLKTDKKVKNGIISFVVVPKPGETIFKNTPINNELKLKLNGIFTN